MVGAAGFFSTAAAFLLGALVRVRVRARVRVSGEGEGEGEG